LFVFVKQRNAPQEDINWVSKLIPHRDGHADSGFIGTDFSCQLIPLGICDNSVRGRFLWPWTRNLTDEAVKFTLTL
jgi:hypothetical protein